MSVLLDAGAGTTWQYKSKESGRVYRRSEGLAVASIEMFKAGLFSSNPNQPHQVDAHGLKQLSLEALARGLQSSETNQLAGMEGRAGVLSRLGDALRNQTYFGTDARPGDMLGKLPKPRMRMIAEGVQTTYFRILQLSLRQSRLFRYPLYGTCLWMD